MLSFRSTASFPIRMRKEILVRLHAAGATHRELRLFSNVSDFDRDAESFFAHRHVVRSALSVP